MNVERIVQAIQDSAWEVETHHEWVLLRNIASRVASALARDDENFDEDAFVTSCFMDERGVGSEVTETDTDKGDK